MKTLIPLLLFALSSLAAPLSAAEVKVFAAASLTDALQELAPVHEAHSGDRLLFNFAASSALARQIKEGAPADVFISADEKQMDGLDAAQLLQEGSRRRLLSNTMVVVVPLDSPVKALSPEDLATLDLKRLALADPQAVPAGVYAREYLEKRGIWARWEPRVIPTENVRAALAAVAAGNVDAGMVYKTDAAISREVRVVLEIPREEGPKISYPLAIVKETGAADAAAKLVAFLQSRAALDIFAKFGFLPAGE